MQCLVSMTYAVLFLLCHFYERNIPSIWPKYRVPSKVIWPSCRNNTPLLSAYTLYSRTSHTPSKISTSAPGLAEYANVHIASAPLSVYAASRQSNVSYLCKEPFSTLSDDFEETYIYGPGRPPKALNPKAVSSGARKSSLVTVLVCPCV
jgi:hypothetical protein